MIKEVEATFLEIQIIVFMTKTITKNYSPFLTSRKRQQKIDVKSIKLY